MHASSSLFNQPLEEFKSRRWFNDECSYEWTIPGKTWRGENGEKVISSPRFSSKGNKWVWHLDICNETSVPIHFSDSIKKPEKDYVYFNLVSHSPPQKDMDAYVIYTLKYSDGKIVCATATGCSLGTKGGETYLEMQKSESCTISKDTVSPNNNSSYRVIIKDSIFERRNIPQDVDDQVTIEIYIVLCFYLEPWELEIKAALSEENETNVTRFSYPDKSSKKEKENTFIIACGGKYIFVHSDIIKEKWPGYFGFCDNFEVSEKFGEPIMIRCTRDNYEILCLIMNYIYYNTEIKFSGLKQLMNILALTEGYHFDEIASSCCDELIALINRSNVKDILFVYYKYGYRPHSSKVKKAALNFICSNFDIVVENYDVFYAEKELLKLILHELSLVAH